MLELLLCFQNFNFPDLVSPQIKCRIITKVLVNIVRSLKSTFNNWLIDDCKSIHLKLPTFITDVASKLCQITISSSLISIEIDQGQSV